MIIKKLYEFWKNDLKHKVAEGRPRVVVACSGGSDSVALFHWLLQFSKESLDELAICHVNFGLRGEDSEGDMQFVENLAKSHGVSFFLKDVRGEQKPRRNIQNWAREVRLAFFHELAEKGYIIALAHHGDDLAENILLRITRGSSCLNLLGMSSWNLPFWRPFLSVRKRDILEFLDGHNLHFRHDVSNDTMKYARNVIRHKVLPELEKLYPGAPERMIAFAEEAQTLSSEFLRSSQENDVMTLSVHQVLSLPESLGLIKLADFLKQNGIGQLSRRVLSQILTDLRRASSGWSFDLRNHKILSKNKDRLHIQERL